MQIKHTGQPYRQMYVSDSYQRVVNNIDNFGDLTGIMTAYAQESFTDAIAKAATYDTTIVVDKPVTISDNLTIPDNIHLIIRKGGYLSVDTGKTLTIDGTVDSAGQERDTIFTGAGTVAYDSVTAFVGKILFEEAPVDGNDKFIEIGAYAINLTQGMRQAAVQISTTRYSDYAMTGSDGNSDMALKVSCTNRSASAGFSRVRALEVTGQLRDGGSASEFVEGAQICAKTRDASTVVDVTVARFLLDHGATGSGNIVGIQMQDVSQSSTGTMYGILLNTSNYVIAREFGIFIDSNAGSWVNAISFNGAITNVFDFEDDDGTNGATIGTYSSNKSTDPTGDIKVDVEGTGKYLYLYANKPTYS